MDGFQYYIYTLPNKPEEETGSSESWVSEATRCDIDMILTAMFQSLPDSRESSWNLTPT